MIRTAALTLCLLIAAPALPSSNDAAWREDVQFLARELPKRHKNAFFHTTPEAFDAATAELLAAIPSLSDAAVTVRMMQLVASIGDAHTSLGGTRFARYPINVYWFSDGLFVFRAAAGHEDLIGLRLAAVGERTIDEVTAAVASVISHENEMWLRSQTPSMLVIPEVLQALGITGDAASARFVFENAAGQRVERDLAALSDPNAATWTARPDELALYRRNSELLYWYEYLPEQRTIFIKYNACREMASKPFAQFRQELFAVALANPIERVILDLRHNPGGSSAILQPLISDIRLNPDINRRDRLFVITGRVTFSSAMLNAIQLEQQTNASFVGEPTGGKPNSYGEVLSFTLPRSGLTVSYSTKYFTMIPGADPPSFAPDVDVPLSSADYFAARDPVLEFILAPRPKRRSVR